MIIIGFIVGIMFDFYRVLRGKTKPKRLITDISDLLFSIIITLIIFISLLYSNGGEMRIYVFLGVILGQIIYYYLLSSYVIVILSKLLNGIYYIYCKFTNIILLCYKNIKKGVVKLKKCLHSRFKK